MVHKASVLVLSTILVSSRHHGVSPSWSASLLPIYRNPCSSKVQQPLSVPFCPITVSSPSKVSILYLYLQHHDLFITILQGANGVGVNRPGRNGTYIKFLDATLNGTVVLQFDCGYSTNVIYSGSTIIINTAPFLWTYGHFYYVTFDSGE